MGPFNVIPNHDTPSFFAPPVSVAIALNPVRRFARASVSESSLRWIPIFKTPIWRKKYYMKEITLLGVKRCFFDVTSIFFGPEWWIRDAGTLLNAKQGIFDTQSHPGLHLSCSLQCCAFLDPTHWDSSLIGSIPSIPNTHTQSPEIGEKRSMGVSQFVQPAASFTTGKRITAAG